MSLHEKPPIDYPSETSKYRAILRPWCSGCGIDIGSGGDPVVPWAWSLELPPDEYAKYNSNVPCRGTIQLRGHADKIPLEDSVLDFVYSSHLLEDFADWEPVLREWVRVLKPNGSLIIIIPEKDLWKSALDNGQPPNDAHRHEGRVGELSTYAEKLGLNVISDQLTDFWQGDYSILFVATKIVLEPVAAPS